MNKLLDIPFMLTEILLFGMTFEQNKILFNAVQIFSKNPIVFYRFDSCGVHTPISISIHFHPFHFTLFFFIIYLCIYLFIYCFICICTLFTPQPLRTVGVLFSPMVSRWAGGRPGRRVVGRREKVCPGCISETVRCRKLIFGRDIC